MWQQLRNKLVEDACEAWRWASMRVMALAATFAGFVEAVRDGWIGIPAEFKTMLPENATRVIGLLVVVAMVARVWKQKA
jgi:hypothetical protein